jgi:hypothetical protein
MSEHQHASHFMAPALFVAGTAMLIFFVAWALGAAGLALPWLVIVCLLVTGVAIKVALSRFGSDDPDWHPDNLRAKRNRDLRQFYVQRHPGVSSSSHGGDTPAMAASNAATSQPSLPMTGAAALEQP